MFNDQLLTQIQEKIPIEEFVGETVALKKAGKYLKGLCPFHPEKTPSFTVSPDKGIFHCFGCHAGGDLFNFLMKLENLSFPEAVAHLAERAGLPFNHQDLKTDPKQKEQKDLLLKLFKYAAWYYHCLLMKADEQNPALVYLQERKISPVTIKEFALGYAPPTQSGLFHYLQTKGFSQEQIHLGSLFLERSGSYVEFFRGRLIFPIFRWDHKVVGLGGRLLGPKDSGPKYLNSPESDIFHKGSLFYGLDLAKPEIKTRGVAMMVEGYFDVISLHQAGFKNALAPLGTAFTKNHAALLKKQCPEVVLAFDGDNAGTQARLKALPVLLSVGIYPAFIEFPPGEDPDSFLKRFGKIALEKKLEERRNLLDDLIDRNAAECGEDFQKKGKAAKVLQSLVRSITDPFVKNLYLRKIAEALEVPEAWLLQNQKSTPWQEIKMPQKNHPLMNFSVEERAILKLWLGFPELHQEMMEKISSGDFITVEALEIYQSLLNTEGNRLSPELVTKISSLMLADDSLDQETAKEYFKEALQKLKLKSLQRELRNFKHLNQNHQAQEELVLLQTKIKELSSLQKETKSKVWVGKS